MVGQVADACGMLGGMVPARQGSPVVAGRGDVPIGSVDDESRREFEDCPCPSS